MAETSSLTPTGNTTYSHTGLPGSQRRHCFIQAKWSNRSTNVDSLEREAVVRFWAFVNGFEVKRPMEDGQTGRLRTVAFTHFGKANAGRNDRLVYRLEALMI